MGYSIQSFQTPPWKFADQWALDNVELVDFGRFTYQATPFFQEPTRAASDLSHNCRVVISSPSQCGKSTALTNILGWAYNYDNSNMLMIMDSMKSVIKFSKNRLKPFLRGQVNLPSLQTGLSVKDKSASVTNYSLGCGHNLLLGASRSASDLCSTPVKYLFCDELDRFVTEINNEGDPLLLAFKRQLRFRGMAVLTSTPTTEEGRITQHFLLGTQEYWAVLCPCGFYMHVDYKDIDFSNDIPTYSCPQCHKVYSENDIINLPHKYHQENPNPFTDAYGRVARSFKVTAPLVHSCYSWDGIHKEEVQARSLGEASIRSFWNTTIGECYSPTQELSINVDILNKSRKYFTRETLPNWVEFITIGADVQDNRFEWVSMGYNSRGTHCCFIEHRVILGDLKKPQVWRDLLSSLNTTYKTKRGYILHPQVVCIDSGGHFTQDVYAFCLQNPRLKPIKGWSHAQVENEGSLIAKVSTVQVKSLGSGLGSIQLTHVNTVTAKCIIKKQFLEIQKNPSRSPWVVSSAEDSNLGLDFFQGIDSEYMETYKSNNRITWKQKPGVRNECLDCTVYGLAAFEILRQSKGHVASWGFTSITDDEDENKDDFPENKDDLPENKEAPLTLDNLLNTLSYDGENKEKKEKTVISRMKRLL